MLWLVGDRTYDTICSMGCPRCIPVIGACMGTIWNESVKVSRLCIAKIKLLGFQDGPLFGLGMFGCNVLCYRWEQSFKEPIQEDIVIKLDLTQTAASPPLMDVVSYVGRSILEAR